MAAAGGCRWAEAVQSRRIVNKECKICGNDSGNQQYTAREMMLGLRHTFPYLECSRCGCLQIATIPSDVGAYYPSGYYSFERPSEARLPGPSLRNRLKASRDRYAISRRGLAGRFLFKLFPRTDLLPFLAPLRLPLTSRILDVGSGSGVDLLQLRAAGFKKVLGVDAFIASDIYYESGVRVVKSSIFETTGEWDLIVFNHSYEHMDQPVKILQHCAELLAPGGCCLLHIPTVSSWAWQHYRTNWVQLDAPRHFFLYSVAALEIVASSAGLRVADILYDSTGFQFWGSEQYVRDIPLFSERSYLKQPGAVFSESDILKFEERARVLNASKQGDQAAFYLRREKDA